MLQMFRSVVSTKQSDQIVVSVGVDPGPVSGHVCFIGPHETVIKPTPTDADGIYRLFDWTGRAQYIIALERQQTFGIEARGRLVKLISEYGQWIGVTAVLKCAGYATVDLVSPKVWQWKYELLLPKPPKEPKQRDFANEKTYKHARKMYRRARERLKTRRKSVLSELAQEKAPVGAGITVQSADAYLLALHAKDVLAVEYGLACFT